MEHRRAFFCRQLMTLDRLAVPGRVPGQLLPEVAEWCRSVILLLCASTKINKTATV